MFKTFRRFIKLYLQSLTAVLKAGKAYAVLLLLIIPLQSVMLSVLIYSSNKIINAAGSKETDSLIFLLSVWAAAFLLSNILTPIYTTVQGFLTDKLTWYLNTSLMSKSKEITNLTVFEDSRFYDDIDILRSEAGWRPVNLLVFGASIMSSVITVLSMLFLLADFSVLISIVILASIIPQGIIFYRIQQEAFEVLVSNSTDSRKLSYYSAALLSKEKIKDIQLYGLYDFFIDKYTETFKNIKKDIGKNRLKKLAASVLFLTITAAVSVFAFKWFIEKTVSGYFLAGSILVFSSGIMYMTQGISRLVEDSSLLYDTLLYMQKYFDFMALLPVKKSCIQNKMGPVGFDSISFENLSFKYPVNTDFALQDVSFSVHRGEKIAIVGENGSGKSTLMKLLCRFYTPSSGRIRFDTNDIETFDIVRFREKIGAVFQDYARFCLTVRENIALSDLKKSADDKAVFDALKKAGFAEDVGGPDMLLGTEFEGGRDISGGQWQKIALARAFFGNFEILILDEPTASIDAKTEFLIYEKFLELTKGKTVFFVTHRLSTVKKADKVLVLKNGKTAGFGSHTDLMQNNAYYKELYDMQAASYKE